MTHQLCHDLIELLSKAKTVEDIHSACDKFSTQFGFDLFLYGARIPTSFVKPYFIFIGTYPQEWRDRYLRNSYILIDPVVQHCASNLTPYSWERIARHERDNKTVRRFMGEAREFGLNSGVSVPIHSAHGEFAILSAVSNLDLRHSKSQIRDSTPFVHMFTTHVHEAVHKIFSKKTLLLAQAHLTDREKECLLWTADGKTSWETSQILKISERTVVFHLQNAADKLGAFNRQHAIARAVSLGLITPQLG